MLARASSDAGTRVRRSKSTSSVHRHHPPISEPFDHEVAQQHAIAAATAAFARAQAQEAAERNIKRSIEVARSKSNASRKSITSTGQGSHFPPRESSFRSMQPQKAGSTTSTQRQSRASTLTTEKFPSFYPTPTGDRPLSAPRSLSTHPSVTFSENSRPSTQPKPTRLSAASSVTSQQIRKARSMYYASSVQTGSPIARPPAKYLTTPPTVTFSPVVHIPSTLPPARTLGPSPLAAPRIPVTVATDESVDNARDKYLQTFQQRSIKHKPSIFLAPFKKRQDKGKDKSSRISSVTTSIAPSSQLTPNESNSDVILSDFLPQREKKDKRSFSGSLKSKIKRVFRRTSDSSSNAMSMPVQQIDASRDYFDTAQLAASGAGIAYAIPSPDTEVLQRVRSRTPSLEGSRPFYLRDASRSSSNGSDRSLHSEVNATVASASRVTSWGTSSTGDTLTQRAMKRLTVIHEAKDSIGSEAERGAFMLTKRKSLPPGTLAAFRDPMPMESLLEESFTPVDPKCVFSALMKEMGTTKSSQDDSPKAERTPGAESDVFESSTTKSLYSANKEVQSSASRDIFPGTNTEQRPPSRRPPSAAAQSTQSKTSSIRTLGRAIRSTIRTVTPGEHASSPCPEKSVNVHSAMQMPEDENSLSSQHTISKSMGKNDSITRFTANQQRTQTCSPSPTQIEKRVERAKDRWKTPLDDVKQLQFPRETNRTHNVTNPAIQAVSYHALNNSKEQCATVFTVTNDEKWKPYNQPNCTDSPVSPVCRSVKSPLSPSVYSRNTDGISLLPNDSTMSFTGPADSDHLRDEGSAVILTSQSVRSYVVGTPSPTRPDSTRTSRDWKAWLSHEVSSMEFTSQEDLRIHNRFLTGSTEDYRGDIRTSHTESDDPTVILRQSCDLPTPRAEHATAAAIESFELPMSDRTSSGSKELINAAQITRSVLDESDSLPGAVNARISHYTPPTTTTALARQSRQRIDSIPPPSDQLPPSTPDHFSSASQPLVETPNSARMNERFPFIKTRRRSSNNSVRSGQSQSPSESVTSSLKSVKAIPNPRVYSDLSGPVSDRVPPRFRDAASKGGEPQSRAKENISPPSIRNNKGKRPAVSQSGLASHPKSLQPVSSPVLNRSSSNTTQLTTDPLAIEFMKHGSSPAATPPRPRIRATMRPISPDKFSRRPKSAFDLRGAPTSKSRPAAELRRPATHIKIPEISLAGNKEPSPGTADRAIDSIIEDDERSGSTTPGQRMADRFLRERKSTGVLERGKLRGGLRLVREDTPAFL
jgi:hypothetical protein